MGAAFLSNWLEDGIGERAVRLEAGETAFRQSDPVHALFRVKSGRVRLIRTLENGATLALHTARLATHSPRPPSRQTRITATPSRKWGRRSSPTQSQPS
jgi:hypothetical protein